MQSSRFVHRPIQIITDPDPWDPQTYGSISGFGSGTPDVSINIQMDIFLKAQQIKLVFFANVLMAYAYLVCKNKDFSCYNANTFVKDPDTLV